MNLRDKTLISFDAAGTLFHPYPSVGAIYRKVALKHDLDYKEDDLNRGFAYAFKKISKDDSILDGEARELSFWRNVVGASIEQFEQKPQNFDALFRDMWETFSHGEQWRASSGAFETLEALRNQGFKIALLTNWDSRVRRVLKENGFERLFDYLFISSEIGHEKPDVETFRHVELATSLKPKDILHVGDSLKHDIEGATKAGWTSVLIGNQAAASTIEYIEQIPDILRHLEK
ncbi:HAD-IA family hydrolase [Puniceicoccaceae bacterium K14]|nr:HAD-IA family hydrolase [Puniceicoccaceae bacterium K14]